MIITGHSSQCKEFADRFLFLYRFVLIVATRTLAAERRSLTGTSYVQFGPRFLFLYRFVLIVAVRALAAERHPLPETSNVQRSTSNIQRDVWARLRHWLELAIQTTK